MAATSSTELPTTSRKRKSWGSTTGQDVLNLVMYKHLQTTDGSNPNDVNGFVYYLEHKRKVVIVDIQPGSLIITVECGSLQKLEELWNDYCTGYVSKMARKFLLTKNILTELGLSKVKFSTSIPREKYRRCHELSRDLQRKCLQLKTLRDEFQNLFRFWVSARKSARQLLKELETALSSSQRRTEQREVPRNRPGWSPWTVLGVAGATVAVVASAPAVALAGAGAAAAGGVGRIAEAANTALGGYGVGDERLNRRKIVEVPRAIDEDENACQNLKIHQKRLGSCVANFAVFCRDHIDSVLSSELLKGEFSSLLYILRGTHSPGAAANAQVPLHVLVNEEVNIHDTRVSTLMRPFHRMRQFHWLSSSAYQELPSITQQILHELQEGPNDDEIQTMITNFIEAKFAEACES